MKRLALPVILAASVFGFTGTAQAASYSLNLDVAYEGSPEGTPPWLKVTFTDIGAPGSGIVELTFEGAGLVFDEFVTEWDLNINPLLEDDLANPGANNDIGDSLQYMSGVEADSVSFKADGFKAGPSDFYDISFIFPKSNSADRLGENELAVYRLTFPSLSAASFLFLSEGGNGTAPDFYAAAHVQGIGEDAELSSWIGADDITFNDDEDPDPPAVPEPSSFVLLGLGAVALAAHRRYARK